MNIKSILSKSKTSLKTRTMYIIILVLTISSSITTFFIMIHVNNVLRKSIANEIHASGLIVRRTIYTNLKYFSLDAFSGMKKFLKGIVKSNNKISYCFITNKKIEIIYQFGKHKKSKAGGALKYPKDFFSKKRKIIETGNYIENIIPIYSNEIVIGYIHIGVKKSIISSEILSLILITVLIFFASLIISIIVLLYFLGKKVINPITSLSLKMKKIANEMNFDKEIKVLGFDEVSQLGKTFNIMIGEIRNYSLNLEDIGKHRTCK